MVVRYKLCQYGLGGGLGIRLDMHIGYTQALIQSARIDVDLHRLRVRIQIARFGSVVPQTRTNTHQQIARRKLLSRQRAGVGAGDTDAETVMIEETFGEK